MKTVVWLCFVFFLINAFLISRDSSPSCQTMACKMISIHRNKPIDDLNKDVIELNSIMNTIKIPEGKIADIWTIGFQHVKQCGSDLDPRVLLGAYSRTSIKKVTLEEYTGLAVVALCK